MGSIVLRLCRMCMLPANLPVGGYMPVNYCTFGEEKREGEERKRHEEHKKKRRRRKKKERGSETQEREREKPPWL